MGDKRKAPSQKVNVHTATQGRHTIPLEYRVPDDLILHYVDNLTIAHTQNEFVISFFQSQLPVITAETDWAKIRKIETRCVSRIVLSPAKIPFVIDAMIKNWNRFIESHGTPESENVGEGNDNTAADTEPES